jgi:adenylyl-sulfate kinase
MRVDMAPSWRVRKPDSSLVPVAQRPATLWLTGLPASGKSTLACQLEGNLTGLGHACYVLDGDILRRGLSRDLGYSARDRRENIRRAAEVAALMNDAGLVVIGAFISPFRDDRAMARSIVGPERFVEVFVDASLETCERRDPKGLYRRARLGEIASFTGVGSPYERPEAADLLIPTGELSVEQAGAILLAAARAAIAHA